MTSSTRSAFAAALALALAWATPLSAQDARAIERWSAWSVFVDETACWVATRTSGTQNSGGRISTGDGRDTMLLVSYFRDLDRSPDISFVPDWEMPSQLSVRAVVQRQVFPFQSQADIAWPDSGAVNDSLLEAMDRSTGMAIILTTPDGRERLFRFSLAGFDDALLAARRRCGR